MSVRHPLTVFYDASCPMCASEMAALKARGADSSLELVDCSALEFDDTVLSGIGITRADLMARLHARDAHGRWLVGLDALEAAYRAAGLERAAALWGSRRLRPILGRLYRWVARRRQVLSRLGLNALVRRALRTGTGGGSKA